MKAVNIIIKEKEFTWIQHKTSSVKVEPLGVFIAIYKSKA